LVGQPHEALAAVERALGQSDAVRLQTANPELRAQLQTPLRLAYDLKIELLRARYDDASAAGRKDEANTLAAAAFTTRMPRARIRSPTSRPRNTHLPFDIHWHLNFVVARRSIVSLPRADSPRRPSGPFGFPRPTGKASDG